MASDPTRLGNDLWVRKTTPLEGVEVIVGRKSLIADNSYHVLRMNGLPELRSIGWLDNAAAAGRPPDCLEFLLVYPRGRYGGFRYTTLRVPVPEAALEQGRRAYYQFAPALERRRARGPIGSAIRAGPCRSAARFGDGRSKRRMGLDRGGKNRWNLYNSQAPLCPLIGGGAGVVFALLLAALTLLLRPKARADL